MILSNSDISICFLQIVNARNTYFGNLKVVDITLEM